LQTLKAHGGVAVWLHLLLPRHQTKVMVKIYASAASLSAKEPRCPSVWGRVGPRVDLDAKVKMQIPWSCKELTENSSVVQLKGKGLQGKACSLLYHIRYMLYFPSNHTGEIWLKTPAVKVFSFTEKFSPLALTLFISPYSNNNLVTKLYFISRSMMELMPMSAWLDYHFNWNHVIL
jgi:hypothetical protein